MRASMGIVVFALAALVALSAAASADCLELPGDANADGSVDVVDVSCLVVEALAGLSGGTASCAAPPLERRDLDCSGVVNVTDVLLAVQYALASPLPVAIDADGDLCADACGLAYCGVAWDALVASSVSGGDGIVAQGPTYDYVPTIMHDGVYRMWWCGGVNTGDHVLYAEADDPAGPWHAPGGPPGSWVSVFQPTLGDTFDGTHTCDPSVLRVNGVYYLYYGAYPDIEIGETTRIGVATSPDGIQWTRMNGGAPIIEPYGDWLTAPTAYGAGQPSVTWVDGYFYMTYTDSTGQASNPVNGAGQYVLRSPDPTFQTNVEELGPEGFHPYDPETHTAFSLIEAFSVDWAYVDSIDAFAMASHSYALATRIHLFSGDLSTEYTDVQIPGTWNDGPGMVTRPDGHAIPHADCGTIPVDILRGLGPGDPWTWDLAYSGADIVTGLDCECVDTAASFEGSIVFSPGVPLTVVRGGQRLQFESIGAAPHLAKTGYEISNEVYSQIPYGASLTVGATVYGAPGRPAAFFLDDGRLWPVSCLEAITANGSTIESITTAQWDSYPVGPSLHCIQ